MNVGRSLFARDNFCLSDLSRRFPSVVSSCITTSKLSVPGIKRSLSQLSSNSRSVLPHGLYFWRKALSRSFRSLIAPPPALGRVLYQVVAGGQSVIPNNCLI
jgi:hypothetical protein